MKKIDSSFWKMPELFFNKLFLNKFFLSSSSLSSPLYLFFPFMHDSQATRFFLEIAECFQFYRPLIIFTGVSRDETLRGEFERYGTTHRMLRNFNPKELQRGAKKMSLLLKAMHSREKVFVLGVASKAFYRTVLNKKSTGMSCWDILPWRYPLVSAEHASLLDGRVVLEEETQTQLCCSDKEREKIFIVQREQLSIFFKDRVEYFVSVRDQH